MKQTNDLLGGRFQLQHGGWWRTKAGAHLAKGHGLSPELGPDNKAAGTEQLYNFISCPPPLSSFTLVPVCDLHCSWPSASVCLCTTDTNRFWRVMWNYPWLFKPHRPYLFLSTACIAVTGVALFMHGLSLCFSTWVLLARGVRRKPLPPCFAQAAGELSGSCGQVFALNEAGRGTSFIRAAPAVISHCNLCFWKLWSTLPWLLLNFVSKACGSQHLLVQMQGDSREGVSYSCKFLAIAS